MAETPRRFIVRVIVAVIAALVIGRFFFQGFSTLKTLLLAAVLLALAYLFNYAKKHE
jgi:hypothetical protein